jgi:hypothetical protein
MLLCGRSVEFQLAGWISAKGVHVADSPMDDVWNRWEMPPFTLVSRENDFHPTTWRKDSSSQSGSRSIQYGSLLSHNGNTCNQMMKRGVMPGILLPPELIHGGWSMIHG